MGQRINDKEPEEIVRLGIFQVMEGRCVFENLTAYENLMAATRTVVAVRKSANVLIWCSIISPFSRHAEIPWPDIFRAGSSRC